MKKIISPLLYVFLIAQTINDTYCEGEEIASAGSLQEITRLNDSKTDISSQKAVGNQFIELRKENLSPAQDKVVKDTLIIVSPPKQNTSNLEQDASQEESPSQQQSALGKSKNLSLKLLTNEMPNQVNALPSLIDQSIVKQPASTQPLQKQSTQPLQKQSTQPLQKQSTQPLQQESTQPLQQESTQLLPKNSLQTQNSLQKVNSLLQDGTWQPAQDYPSKNINIQNQHGPQGPNATSKIEAPKNLVSKTDPAQNNFIEPYRGVHSLEPVIQKAFEKTLANTLNITKVPLDTMLEILPEYGVLMTGNGLIKIIEMLPQLCIDSVVMQDKLVVIQSNPTKLSNIARTFGTILAKLFFTQFAVDMGNNTIQITEKFPENYQRALNVICYDIAKGLIANTLLCTCKDIKIKDLQDWMPCYFANINEKSVPLLYDYIMEVFAIYVGILHAHEKQDRNVNCKLVMLQVQEQSSKQSLAKLAGQETKNDDGIRKLLEKLVIPRDVGKVSDKDDKSIKKITELYQKAETAYDDIMPELPDQKIQLVITQESVKKTMNCIYFVVSNLLLKYETSFKTEFPSPQFPNIHLISMMITCRLMHWLIFAAGYNNIENVSDVIMRFFQMLDVGIATCDAKNNIKKSVLQLARKDPVNLLRIIAFYATENFIYKQNSSIVSLKNENFDSKVKEMLDKVGCSVSELNQFVHAAQVKGNQLTDQNLQVVDVSSLSQEDQKFVSENTLENTFKIDSKIPMWTVLSSISNADFSKIISYLVFKKNNYQLIDNELVKKHNEHMSNESVEQRQKIVKMLQEEKRIKEEELDLIEQNKEIDQKIQEGMSILKDSTIDVSQFTSDSSNVDAVADSTVADSTVATGA